MSTFGLHFCPSYHQKRMVEFGAPFQTWLFKYIGLMSVLGQGMTYIPEERKVIYQSKDGKEEKVFDALEWLAA